MVTASIVIVAKNEEKTLPLLLHMIQKQSFQDFEVVFIDNMSTDSTPRIVEEFAKRSGIPVYYERRGGTLGSLYNRSVELACGKYILIIDADEIPVAKWVEEHLKCLESGHHACIAPVIYYDPGGTWSQVSKWYFNRSILEIMYNRLFAASRIVFNTGNTSFRAEALKKVQFHPHLGVSEDGEMSYRFVKHGYRLGLAEKAYVFHPAPDDLRKHASYWWKLAYAQRALFHVHKHLDLAKVLIRNNLLAHLDPRETVKSSLWHTSNLLPSIFMHITAFSTLLGTHLKISIEGAENVLGKNIQRLK